MGLEPITVALTKYQELEILRAEEEERAKEFADVEKKIRDVLWELERVKYLQRVHPHFRLLKIPDSAAQVPQLEQYRQSLAGALETLKGSIQALEKELLASGQTLPPAAAGQARKAKFDSFDDFRRNR